MKFPILIIFIGMYSLLIQCHVHNSKFFMQEVAVLHYVMTTDPIHIVHIHVLDGYSSSQVIIEGCHAVISCNIKFDNYVHKAITEVNSTIVNLA